MAYITRKKIKGSTYYYAEQREWKDGKSRRKWQKYLGTIDKIIKAIDNKERKPEYAIVFELGGVSAYLDISREINITEIINSMLPKREQGITVGEYILIAAINRGLNAVSKRSIWNWFEDTILLNYFSHIKKEALSSQRFWDNMSLIKEDIIPEIWMKIIQKAITVYNIDLSLISYDGTNFYTFISSFNTRCTIAQRGKNKQGRKNLRQVNYALFCSREDHIPLYFDTYEGNTHDSPEFNKVINRFKEAYSGKISDDSSITIVFDKGNNSKENMEDFDKTSFHFIGSLKLDDYKELAMISNKDSCFKSFDHTKLEEIKAFRLKKVVYEKERTLIITFNNNLYNDQVRTVNNDIEKCVQRLSELSQRLNDRANGIITKGKKPTIDSVKKSVKDILKRQYMKKVIKVNYKEKNKILIITYTVDMEELAKLADSYLGKKIIFTDNHHWKTEDIIIAYHSQYVIEDVFKETKDRKLGCWWPMYHYTDQKIKVHGLYCTITMLIRSLMSRKVRQQNLRLPMVRMHNKLIGIKEVINFYPKEKGAKRLKKINTLTKMDETQKRLFEIFNMSKYVTS